MKGFLFAIVVGLFTLSACNSAPTGPSNVTVKEAWARPATLDQVGGAYMVIENSGGADRVASLSTDAAGMAEIHETKVENGMSSMQPVQGGLEIPANGKVELKPGSYHVMMMNLKRELKPGDKLAFMLKLQSGKEIPFTAEVRSNS